MCNECNEKEKTHEYVCFAENELEHQSNHKL